MPGRACSVRKFRYAMADVPGVELKEYEVSLTIRGVEPLE